MTLQGDRPLSVNERLGILLTSAVAIVSLLGTVWYAAIAVNNLTHEISTANNNISRIEQAVSSQSVEADNMYEIVYDNKRGVELVKKTSPKVLDISNKYVLMTSDGKSFKLVRYNEDS